MTKQRKQRKGEIRGAHNHNTGPQSFHPARRQHPFHTLGPGHALWKPSPVQAPTWQPMTDLLAQGWGKGSHVRGRNCSMFAHVGVYQTFNIPKKSEDEKEEEERAEEEEKEEEKEEIHEVGQNSASFQRKPVENCSPFLRLSSEGSRRPNYTAWMVHPILHKATRDSVNEKNTLGLWGLSHPILRRARYG